VTFAEEALATPFGPDAPASRYSWSCESADERAPVAWESRATAAPCAIRPIRRQTRNRER